MDPETPQLTFRRYAADDLDRVAEWFTDPEMMRYYGGVKTRAETEEWLCDRVIASWERYGHSYWVLTLKATGEPIGHCGILPQVVDNMNELEVGYFLHRDFWGRGLATEAAGACYAHAFDALRRDRIISIIHPDNVASIRVAEKNGLVLEKSTTWRGNPANIYAKTR